MKTVTVVIPAVRSSVVQAARSAVREGFDVVVVSDGANLPSMPFAQCYSLGRNFGRMDGTCYYGQIAMTVGAFMARSPFVQFLGDDDEIAPGYGDILRRRIEERPEIDMWQPGLLYNDGNTCCMDGSRGLVFGNVSHTCYRQTVFASWPMFHIAEDKQGAHDFLHIHRCVEKGFKSEWIGHVGILVRPDKGGTSGKGLILELLS